MTRSAQRLSLAVAVAFAGGLLAVAAQAPRRADDKPGGASGKLGDAPAAKADDKAAPKPEPPKTDDARPRPDAKPALEGKLPSPTDTPDDKSTPRGFRVEDATPAAREAPMNDLARSTN